MANARTVPVLMHHHVSNSPGMITVSPENFESQIAWLARTGWTSLTLDQYAGFSPGSRCRAIDRDHVRRRLPGQLGLRPSDPAEYGMHAVVFVVTGWMHEGPIRPHAGIEGAELPATPEHRACEDLIYKQGRSDEVMMRWSEARAAIEAGTFEVHCHTHSHTRWLKRDDLDRAQRREGISGDLAMAKQTLLEKLGEVSDTLCWPYGDFDDDYIEVAREQGFRYLHTTHPFGRNVIGGDPERIYRFAIRNRPASWLRKRIAWSYNPLIAPIFNGFKARQKKMVPGP